MNNGEVIEEREVRPADDKITLVSSSGSGLIKSKCSGVKAGPGKHKVSWRIFVNT